MPLLFLEALSYKLLTKNRETNLPKGEMKMKVVLMFKTIGDSELNNEWLHKV